MDNVGGHGTKDAIETYVQLLKDKFNVIVEHQTPRSPEFNLLDLGFSPALNRLWRSSTEGREMC